MREAIGVSPDIVNWQMLDEKIDITESNKICSSSKVDI